MVCRALLSMTICTATMFPAAGFGADPGVITLRGSGPLLSKSAVSKVGGDLVRLHAEYQAHRNSPAARASVFKSANPLVRVAQNSVAIDTAAEGDPQVLAADLRALGAERVTVFGRQVSVRLPVAAIPALRALPSLRLARPAYAITQTGSVTSQGDASMRAEVARATYGVDGSGVLVGTISDSYDCNGGAADGVASGDLPSGVMVLEEANCEGNIDEGRAMMELIHDVAPGAGLAFHTGFLGIANFAQGILDLAAAGAKVINDDLLYFAEPMFQDGIIAQAVDTVKAGGVAYFSSSGNQGRQSYESVSRFGGRLTVTIGGTTRTYQAHDFDPGPGMDICQEMTVPAFATVIVPVQWDEPFFSVSGAPGSASNLDVFLTNADCDRILSDIFTGDPSVGIDDNLGGDAVEVVGFLNFSFSPSTINLVVGKEVGPAPGRLKTVVLGGTIDEHRTRSGPSYGHANTRGAMGVGAAYYLRTPAFGVNPPLIEIFSSAGGTPILFDTRGNRLATAEVRQQPSITAPDGTDTTFFGDDRDGNGLPNFSGTSAAAPHAAAVAALMKQRNPSLTPTATYAALKATAIDMDDPLTPGFDTGFDFASGFGLIQADAALAAVQPPRGSVQFSSATYSVNEGTATASITLTRTGGSFGAASVKLSTANGTATAGSDYTARVNVTVSWSDGDAATKTVSVPISNDAADEADETVNLSLNAATGASLGAPAGAVLTIVDNDDAVSDPSVSFETLTAEPSVAENVGSYKARVVLSRSQTQALTVRFTYAGSAKRKSDYTAPDSITIAAGQTSANLSIKVINDTRKEPAERVVVNLVKPSNAQLGGVRTRTLTITAND